MTLSKIKQANKKARHEQKRKAIRGHDQLLRNKSKIHNKRMRAMVRKGRMEHRKRRQAEKSYVENLEAEL